MNNAHFWSKKETLATSKIDIFDNKPEKVFCYCFNPQFVIDVTDWYGWLYNLPFVLRQFIGTCRTDLPVLFKDTPTAVCPNINARSNVNTTASLWVVLVKKNNSERRVARSWVVRCKCCEAKFEHPTDSLFR